MAKTKRLMRVNVGGDITGGFTPLAAARQPAQLDPNWRKWAAVDPDFLQQMGTTDALAIQQRINALAQADQNLSAGDLTRFLVETLRQQAGLRGGRMEGISDQAAAFANQLAQQAMRGDMAGVQPNFIQTEFDFEPDNSRRPYWNPRPLEDAIDVAADQGLPYGYKVAHGDYSLRPSDVARVMRDEGGEFLEALRQSLIADGIPGAEVTPLSSGAYSAAFESPATDEVVKFTFNGARQYADPANGVWGVLSPRRVAELPTSYRDFAYSIYPRAELGRATNADHDTLKDALRRQGWYWDDDHMGNIGMLAGKEYRPVVIDAADVRNSGLLGSVKYPFVPPSGPLYNWLIPTLAAGGAAATATLGGQQAATAADGGGTLSMPPQPMGPVYLSGGTDGNAAPPTQGGDSKFDFSMAISPNEWQSWYGSDAYGGEEHQQFQAAVDRVMDVPAIPERYITERLGVPQDMWETYFPGYQGGDMTPRQFAQGAQWLAIAPAMLGAMEEANQGIKDGPYAKTIQAMAIPGIGQQLASDVASEFAGMRRDRSDKGAEIASQMILGGIQSGVSGGEFAERDEVTRSEDKRIRDSFAKDGREGESEFYVTPGGQQNYRREASLQLLRTLQDGQFAPPGMTSLDYVGNRLFDQTVGNIQRAAGEEYNPRDVNGFGRADWRADSLMDSSAPRGRMKIALDLYNRTPEWARSSEAQAQEREAQGQASMQALAADSDQIRRVLDEASGMSPDLSAALMRAGAGQTAARDARAAGYRQVNPDAVDRFDTGTAAGLSNVLYNNQSFTPAQYAQWFDPILGQVNDRISLGNDSGSFTKQMNRDLDSVRRVRGDKESEDAFDRRADWYADKKEQDRDYRSAYWGPYLADLGNQSLGGNAFTGKKFERSFLSPAMDTAANLGQDFVRNIYNAPTVAASAIGGGVGGLARQGVSGAVKGGARGAAVGAANEILDEAREEGAIQLGAGLLDFRPQKTNAFARDVEAPQGEWQGGQPPQLDPNDPDYWRKFGKAYDYHQGRSAGFYDSWRRGLLD